MQCPRLALPLVLGGFCLLAFPARADAYLDPGTGSVLVQLLLGGVAGALALVKLYWGRIKTLLPGARARAVSSEEPRAGG